jgi:glutamine amidotransferase
LRSVAAAVAKVGGAPEVTSDPNAVRGADRIILPGVGAFGLAAEYLHASGVGPAIVAAADRGTPILGICLGMQLLFERGNEFGWSSGLGLIRGEVLPIWEQNDTGKLRGTHIGWRELDIRPSQENHSLFKGMAPRDAFYFVHSFSAKPGADHNVLASVSYGTRELVVAVGEQNVTGVQFHPEKSGMAGLGLLGNFLQV